MATKTELTKTQITDTVKSLARSSLPQSWYNLVPLVQGKDIHEVKLKAPESRLFAWLILSYALCVIIFFLQVAYYRSITITEFVITDQYNLPGHTCRPLQKDPLYGLQITYDECLETHYDKVTTDNLFEPSIDAKYAALNGPWNFSKHTKGYSYDDTFYHKPFPTLTDVVYTLHPTCKVETYPGLLKDVRQEKKSLEDLGLPRFPMDDAYEDAQVSPGLHSYSSTCIMNKKCTTDVIPLVGEGSLGPTCEYGAYRTFYPEAGTDFLRECDKGGGTEHFKNSRYDFTGLNTTVIAQGKRPEKNFFTADMQAGLYAHGGYVCPHVWARDLLIDGYHTISTYSYYRDSAIFLQIKPRSMGIRSMYPLNASFWEDTRGMKIGEETVIQTAPSAGYGWFGSPPAPSYIREIFYPQMDFMAKISSRFYSSDKWRNGENRCEFYEREMARQGFEFIYSHENCHPCDAFKLNTPFQCETVVKKTAAEIIGLSVSNVMALLGGLTVIAPLVLGASIQSKKEEEEAGSSGEGDDATITGITIKSVDIEIDDEEGN